MIARLKTMPPAPFRANFVHWLFPVLCGILPWIQGCKSNSGSKKNNKIYYPATLTEVKSQTGVGQTSSRYTFTYDGQHRIVSRTADFDPGMRSVYAYTDGAYTEDLYVNDSLATQNNYTINSLNLVDSLVQFDLPDHDTLSARFLYNAGKQLIGQKQYFYTADYGFLLYNSITYAYDSSSKNLLTASDGYKVVSYTYSSENFNSLSLGQIYMQHLPTLPDMETTVQSTGEMTSTGHVYSFDAEGRLLTDQSAQSDGTTILRTYTY